MANVKKSSERSLTDSRKIGHRQSSNDLITLDHNIKTFLMIAQKSL